MGMGTLNHRVLLAAGRHVPKSSGHKDASARLSDQTPGSSCTQCLTGIVQPIPTIYIYVYIYIYFYICVYII